VGQHGGTGQTIDDNKIRCMRSACWRTKATSTNSEYVTDLFDVQVTVHRDKFS